MKSLFRSAFSWVNPLFDALTLSARDVSGHDYAKIRRKIMIFSSLVVLAPLLLLLVSDSQRLKEDLAAKAQAPVRFLFEKRRDRLIHLLNKKVEALRLVTSLYTLEELRDEGVMGRVFKSLNEETGTVVDVGLIAADGEQASAYGPQSVAPANFLDMDWFLRARDKGGCVSGVFLGHRRTPHLVTAVRRLDAHGSPWVLRATVDASALDALMVPVEPEAEAFLVDRAGVLQTPSVLFGKALEKPPLALPQPSRDLEFATVAAPDGRLYLAATAPVPDTDFLLVTLSPHLAVLGEVQAFRLTNLLVFLLAGAAALFAVRRISGRIVSNIRESHEARDKAVGERHFKRLSFVRTLATGIGHEINNPLAIINENVGLLKDMVLLSKSIPEEDKRKFETVAAKTTLALDRCRKITHYLIGYQNLFDEKLGFHDVNELVRLASGVIGQEAVEKSVHLRLELDKRLPSIATYSRQLQEVFVNVLSNAVTASRPGQTVTVQTIQRKHGTVIMRVMDEGAGMNEETLRHIFDPFFTTKKTGSTGLGMYITSSILNRLGGDIHIESILGQGTVVDILLPVRSQDLLEEEARPKDEDA